MDPTGFDQLPDNLALDLLSRLLRTIGGRIYPPRRQALLCLLELMQGATLGRRRSRSSWTLAHCRILMHRARWLICREGNVSETLLLRPGRQQCWDSRFLVSAKPPWRGLTIKALGQGTPVNDNTLMEKKKKWPLPAVVKASLPGVWQQDKLIAIPLLGLYAAFLLPEDFDLRFCPPTPLANAPFRPHIGG